MQKVTRFRTPVFEIHSLHRTEPSREFSKVERSPQDSSIEERLLRDFHEKAFHFRISRNHSNRPLSPAKLQIIFRSSESEQFKNLSNYLLFWTKHSSEINVIVWSETLIDNLDGALQKEIQRKALHLESHHSLVRVCWDFFLFFPIMFHKVSSWAFSFFGNTESVWTTF